MADPLASQSHLELTTIRSGQKDSPVRLPALIHVGPDAGQIDFVAIEKSPWDNDELKGPFCPIAFLMWATFSARDDLDLWETQRDQYQAEVEREVNRYGCGWFDGGCFTFARALQLWLGGRLAIIVREELLGEQAFDHVVLSIPNLCI